MNLDQIDIREVDANGVMPLRTRVLRPQYDENELLEYEGDDAENAHHFAAIVSDLEPIVAVITYLPDPLPVEGEAAELRLRGMAVSGDLRRQGIGSHLLSATLPKVALYHPEYSRVWAAARTSVTQFYSQHGFEPVGPRFEMPSVGPHQRMVRQLPPVLA